MSKARLQRDAISRSEIDGDFNSAIVLNRNVNRGESMRIEHQRAKLSCDVMRLAGSR